MATKGLLSEHVISSLQSAKKYLLTSILALSTVSVMAYAGQQSGVGQVVSDVNPASPKKEQALKEAKIFEIVSQAGYTLPDIKFDCGPDETLLNIAGVTNYTSGFVFTPRYIACKKVTPGPYEFVNETPTYSIYGMYKELAALGYALPGSDFRTCRDNFTLTALVNQTNQQDISTAHLICRSNTAFAMPNQTYNRDIVNGIVAKAGYALPNLFNKCINNDSVIVDIVEVVNETTSERHGVCKQITSEITPENVTTAMFSELSKLGYTLLTPNFTCENGFTQVSVNTTVYEGYNTEHYLCENNTVRQNEIDSQLLRIVSKAGYSLPTVNGQCADSGRILEYVFDFNAGMSLQYGVCVQPTSPVPADATATMFSELAQLDYALLNSNSECNEGYSKVTVSETINGTTIQHYMCRK